MTVNAAVVADEARRRRRLPAGQAAGGADAPEKTTLEGGTPSAVPIAFARAEALAHPLEDANEMSSGGHWEDRRVSAQPTSSTLAWAVNINRDAPLKEAVAVTVPLRLPYAAVIAERTADVLKALALATAVAIDVVSVYDGGGGDRLGG